MTPEMFIGFAIGAFTGFVITTVFMGTKFHAMWEENRRLRIVNRSLSGHPTLQQDIDFQVLGEWGSALEGWTDNESS